MLLEGDVPKCSNMLTGSSIITIKEYFMARGNRESEKDRIFHDVTTAQQSSVRQLAAIGPIMGFDV